MPGGSTLGAFQRFPPQLLAALGLLLLPAPQTQACTCPEPPPPSEALKGAVAVFVGRVVEIRGRKADYANGVLVKLRVRRAWKGVASETALVTTPPDSGACGYGFQSGKDYLVYAYARKSGRFQTNICTRTTTLARARADLAVLGPAAFTGRSAGKGHKKGIAR